ncbi:hypothetical protein ACSHWO_02770 [Streptomyces sp. HUAS TT3]|uniref:hypothetical protein n=1 Tax=Streptomyces sp. HUAS TT3 TaxID=3447510 RepID=UPI003F65C4F6
MSSTEVTVVVSDCAEEDARAVFATLDAAFTTERTTRPRSGTGATVWTSAYDVATPGERSPTEPAAPLAHQVSVEAQGGYRAVDQLVAVLDSAYVIDTVGTAAGDQEKDIHLRLHGRAMV